DLEDDGEVRRLYIHEWVKDTGRYDNDLLLISDTYARRVVAAEWLRELGYDPEIILNFDNLDLLIQDRVDIDANAVMVSLTLWMKHHQPDIEIPDGLTIKEMFK